ncbi:MAG: UDP-2,3-diacylglucosamine diphosphatase [Bacteroidales bacterium]|jgi:UDP-2,3-diacylglucosamine hydrolase|nr:UDP-2,3-diacylglucosamine diphosphatase [Bacteroidales bacterium]
MQTINGNVYFISDAHFGLPNKKESDLREKRIVTFLEQIENEVTHLFLMGDIFDFWFEYKDVVPRNQIRFLGKLAQMADKGIKLYYFLGNHDMWHFDYLQKEIGWTQLSGIEDFMINGKKVRMGHGDALDPTDKGYLLIKWIYGRKINQKLFGALHPRWSFAIARAVSLKSRKAHLEADRYFHGEENEPIITYCKQILENEHFDYFLFAHRHYPLEIRLNNESIYINLGDWQFHDSYVQMKDGNCHLYITHPPLKNYEKE